MKTLNLVVAIIYTMLFVWMFLLSIYNEQADVLFGCIILSGPLIVNWITYNNLPKQSKTE